MSELSLRRPTLDSPAGSAAVILHHLPISPTILQDVIVGAGEQLTKLRSVTVYRLVSEPLYELSGTVDAMKRTTYTLFGLMYAIFAIGTEAPNSFEHCTFETTTCPLGKECQLCHPHSDNNLRQWKLRHLADDIRLAIKTLVGGQRNKTSTSNELTRKGNEVRFLERAEKAIVAGHSSKSGFLGRLQNWLAAIWTTVVVPNFPLLNFMMRTECEPERNASPVCEGPEDYSPTYTRNRSPVYSPVSPSRASMRESSPVYSPVSPRRSSGRGESPVYSSFSPTRGDLREESPTYCPRTPR